MQRVSEKRTAKKTTYYKNVVDNYEINKAIKEQWRGLHEPEMTVGDLLDKIESVVEWEIDGPTRDHLVLRFYSYTRLGKKKWTTMADELE
ncbi:MAG: hypothetical protein AAF438_21235, partial [Pseudomonadota bacterium]